MTFMKSDHETSLPGDRPDQVYVSLAAMKVGTVELPDIWLFQDAYDAQVPDSVRTMVPIYAFLIEHPTKGKAMFDLGIRKPDGEGVAPAMQERVRFMAAKCDQDVVDILGSGGIEPEDIDSIIFSHLHWDHVGDPTPFTSAELVIGADAVSLLQTSYPTNPKSTILALPPSRRVVYMHFSPSHMETINEPFGPFERTIDFYGDGSLYLIDAPGHLDGHLAAAARVGPRAFVVLAGDTCHSRACYCPGNRTFGPIMNANKEVARETIGRLKKLDQEHPNAVVVLAHELERETEDGMPFFPERLNEWAVELAKKRAAQIA